jgi:hypothetical protein
LASISGTITRQQMKVPVRLTSSTRRKSSVLCSQVFDTGPRIPALLIRKSMRSKRFSTALAAAVTAASSVVSTGWPSARSPSSCAAAATPAASWSHSATDAPDACSRAAIARPKPPAPPVMTAVRPVKS